ncbi:MAG: DUF58 domain-containing protein [Spirochaetales bacterium]|nr:DUF58 domain-containing protein [Spirochaetales bacterium]
MNTHSEFMAPAKTFLRPVLFRFSKLYPFTLFGTVLFAAGIVLLVLSFYSLNPAGFIFSIAAIVMMAVMGITGKIAAAYHNKKIYEWDSKTPMIARVWNIPQFIYSHDFHTIPFFRLSFMLTGRGIVGRKSVFLVREEQVLEFDSSGKAVFTVYMPLAGMMNVNGIYSVRDIFGLTNNVFGKLENRIIPVLPAGAATKELRDIITSQGYEDSVKRRSQDLERYFMREYIPGDRMRDINWQASQRLQKLITKISPVTQEQAKSLVIFFRNIKDHPEESLESVVHLDRIKSNLVTFLRLTKEAYPEYVFHVYTAMDKFILEGDDDIERFSRDVSSMWFVNSHDQSFFNPNIGDFFVFTTYFDTQLDYFLSIFPKSKKTIIQTWKAAPGTVNPAKFTLFTPFRASLIPGGFVFRKEPGMRPRMIQPSEDIDVQREYLDIRLS